MPEIVVEVKPATVVMTGIEFMQYGNHYLDSAEYVSARRSSTWFDPLPYQLFCQSLELHLKSYIWFVDRLRRQTFKTTYGHDMVKLWNHAKERKISRFCKLTEARDSALNLLGPYYKGRKFAYLDLSMSSEGIPELRQHPEAKHVVKRLCKQLQRSLHRPILEAS